MLVAVAALEIRSSPQQAPHPEHSDATNGEVILVSLSRPTFSPLARQANVEGEVVVNVTVHQDGSTEATVVKGHPLLKQGALESAMRSRFECRACSASLSYTLVYTFKRTSEGSCCDGLGAPVKVEQDPQSLRRARATAISCHHFSREDMSLRPRPFHPEEGALAEMSLPLEVLHARIGIDKSP